MDLDFHLIKNFGDIFDVLKIEEYTEMEKNDSIYVVLRK